MATWDPRANDIFVRALDTPPGDRAAFLDAACADNPTARVRVEVDRVVSDREIRSSSRRASSFVVARIRASCSRRNTRPYQEPGGACRRR